MNILYGMLLWQATRVAMAISGMCNTQALLGVYVLLIVLDYTYLTYIHTYTYIYTRILKISIKISKDLGMSEKV